MINSKDVILFSIGLFLIGAGAGTSDIGSLKIGGTLGLIGLALMFFSFKENRNPNRLRRLGKQLLGYLKW